MKPIQVFHIRDSSGIFGAERVIFTLLKNIPEANINLSLICFRRKDGRSQRLIDTAQNIGIDVIPIDVHGRFDLKALHLMRSILVERQVDIIHTHDFKSDLYGLIATTGTSIKRISTAHGSTRDSLRKRLYLQFTEKGTYRFFHKIIAVSKELSDYLLSIGVPPIKIETIQNGMDFSLIETVPVSDEVPLPDLSDRIVFSIVGRLYPDKGHRYFLEAFNRVHRNFPNTAALIVGDGPERMEILNHIKKLGLGECVHYCGVRMNMAEVYEKSDCIVIPSLTEGLPYVLLEAMSKHVPVIATPVGDIPLLIEQGKTGYIAQPGDDDDLEQKMLLYLQNSSLNTKLASQAYQIVTHRYSAVKMAKKTELLYLQLTEK